MTLRIRHKSLSPEAASFLAKLRDGILWQLPLDTLPPDVCQDIRRHLEKATLACAITESTDQPATDDERPDE